MSKTLTSLDETEINVKLNEKGNVTLSLSGCSMWEASEVISAELNQQQLENLMEMLCGVSKVRRTI